jgi:adenylyltransferase/sulfurtransferase
MPKRLAIVGLGGLGGPAALALAEPGHELILIDADRVERSNLHRQVCYGEADIGTFKADALQEILQARGLHAEARRARLAKHNIDALLEGADAVLEATDSFAAKFLCNDWCAARGVPAIIAAAERYRGHMFPVHSEGPCYRCLFEAPPEDAEAGSCSTAGVLGPVCGVVAAAAVRAAQDALQGRASVPLFWHDMRRTSAPRPVPLVARSECTCSQRKAAAAHAAAPSQPLSSPVERKHSWQP